MYGKIFEEIFDSTIITHGKDVLYVFMSMIVLSDEHGFLRFSIPALANRILMEAKEVESAVKILLQPDPDSNNKAHDGRRIVPIAELTEGSENRGWFLVNKELYKQKASKSDQKEKTKARVKRFRECNAAVTHGNALKRSSNDFLGHTDTDTDTIKDLRKNIARTEDFFSFWKAYPKKRNKGDAEKAWKKLKPTPELVEKILESIRSASKSEDWRKDAGQFIPYPASWLNAKGWEDTFDTKGHLCMDSGLSRVSSHYRNPILDELKTLEQQKFERLTPKTPPL